MNKNTNKNKEHKNDENPKTTTSPFRRSVSFQFSLSAFQPFRVFQPCSLSFSQPFCPSAWLHFVIFLFCHFFIFSFLLFWYFGVLCLLCLLHFVRFQRCCVVVAWRCNSASAFCGEIVGACCCSRRESSHNLTIWQFDNLHNL